MPNQPKTPVRSIRVDDDLWGYMGEIAREQGRPVTAVVVDALKRYVTWHKREAKRAGKAGQPESSPSED